MIEEIAIVTDVGTKWVTVESELKSSCHGCAQQHSCANGQINKALPKKQLNFRVEDTLGLAVGDKVVIALPQDGILSAAWQTYLWPVFFALFTALVMTPFFAEGWVVLATFFGGYVGYRFAAWRLAKRAYDNPDWLQVKILRKACESIPVQQV